MSRDAITLPRGLVSFRQTALGGAAGVSPVAVGGARAASAPAAAAVDARGLSVAELKEIQRHAFERGQAFERERIVERLGGLVRALDQSREAFDKARVEETTALAEFGVEVALAVAGELVGTAIRDRAHDARALVERALADAFPGGTTHDVTILLHPDDMAALNALTQMRPIDGCSRIKLVGDGTVAAGCCQLKCAGAEYHADVEDRLQAMAVKLRGVARAGNDGGSGAERA